MGPERLHFRRAHTLVRHIEAAFADEQAKIRGLLPSAEVRHTGATSVADALTRGDLDIHVRVSPERFSEACDVLAAVYDV